MKFIEKLKNVFFEEVPEDDDEEELPQTFAKKIEPKRVVEPSKEEEKREEEKSAPFEEFEEVQEPLNEEKEEEPEKEDTGFPMMFDDDDFLTDTKPREEESDYTPSTAYRYEEKPEKE